MKYRFVPFLLVCSLLQLSNCGKNVEITKIDEEPPPQPIELIRASLSGNIQDLGAFPLEAAEVTLHETTTYTDPNGYFSFDKVLIPKDGGPLTVSYGNHFDSYHLLNSNAEANNYRSITLQPIQNTFQFNGEDGFEWTSGEGVFIRIPPMSVIDADGLIENDLISIAVKWENPVDSNDDIISLMDFSGKNSEAQEVVIQHAGILKVQMTNLLGRPLEAQGIQIQVPFDALQLEAGQLSNLRIWNLQTSSSYWKEAEAPEINNQFIETTLPKGKLWSFGVPTQFTLIEGVVNFDNGRGQQNPLPFQELLLIEESSNSATISFVSDDQGRYKLQLPRNVNYRVEVPDLCNQQLQLQEPISWVSAAALSSIILNGSHSRSLITKQFVDCDNEPITEGYLCLKSMGIADQIFPLNPLREGKINIPLCTTTDISFDLYDQKQDKTWTNLSPSLVLNNFQTVARLCDTVPTFFDLTLSSQEFLLAQCQVSIVDDPENPGNSLTQLRAFNSPFTPNSDIVELLIEGDATGTFSIRSMTIKLRDFRNELIKVQKSQIETMANIQVFGEKNQAVGGNLQGTIETNDLGVVELTAQFNALRIN